MGIKSPIIGMNSIVFIAVDTLLLVMEYSKLVVITSNTSPITGMSNKGVQSSLRHQKQ